MEFMRIHAKRECEEEIKTWMILEAGLSAYGQLILAHTWGISRRRWCGYINMHHIADTHFT